jgi:tRNA A-37 threonylcarbamoyl transferase component Bud32
MAPTIPEIPYDDIKPLIGQLIHAGRSAVQADVYEIQWNGRPAIIKDFTARPAWLRTTWGSLMIGREFRALRRVQGIEGIPRLLARAGPYALVMQRIHGDRFPRRRETPPPVEFFDRASLLLKSLHDRGVGHGDVRRKNLMMDAEARPHLIDFATAVAAKPGAAGVVSRALFRRYCVVDAFQLAQMKADFHPDRLTDEERALLKRPPWYLMLGQFLKRYVYRYRKARHRRRLWNRLLGPRG